jgi:hypothetical protein
MGSSLDQRSSQDVSLKGSFSEWTRKVGRVSTHELCWEETVWCFVKHSQAILLLALFLICSACAATPPQNGIGTFIWPDGSSYSGEWRNGQQFGRGVFVGASGQRYEGSWAYGLPDGQGIYTWPDGRRYVGAFQRDKFHGQGKQTWPSGESYEGAFDSGEISGYGIYRWPSGDRYEGYVTKGLRSGQGVFTWADGGFHRGSWKNDARDGDGTEYSKNGSIVRTGRWSNNKFISDTMGDKAAPTREVPKTDQVNRIPILISKCFEKGLKPGTKEFSDCIAGS